jgi:hypothetical protein
MCKKTRLTLAMLGLAGVTFAASTGRVVVSKQGMIARRIPGAPVLSVPRTDYDDPVLVRIFSNISKYRKSPYWGWTSASVNGPHDGYGDAELWTGAPFTPTANHTVTTVKVAATWYGGINGLVLSLNDDANGVPGAAIETWQLKNLPSNLCCAIQVVTDGAGIPVTAGRQYWIVLSTNSKEANTDAGWDLSEVNQADGATLAQYCSNNKGGNCAEYGLKNNAWTAFSSLYGVAFAVLGSS